MPNIGADIGSKENAPNDATRAKPDEDDPATRTKGTRSAGAEAPSPIDDDEPTFAFDQRAMFQRTIRENLGYDPGDIEADGEITPSTQRRTARAARAGMPFTMIRYNPTAFMEIIVAATRYSIGEAPASSFPPISKNSATSAGNRACANWPRGARRSGAKAPPNRKGNGTRRRSPSIPTILICKRRKFSNTAFARAGVYTMT